MENDRHHERPGDEAEPRRQRRRLAPTGNDDEPRRPVVLPLAWREKAVILDSLRDFYKERLEATANRLGLAQPILEGLGTPCPDLMFLPEICRRMAQHQHSGTLFRRDDSVLSNAIVYFGGHGGRNVDTPTFLPESLEHASVAPSQVAAGSAHFVALMPTTDNATTSAAFSWGRGYALGRPAPGSSHATPALVAPPVAGRDIVTVTAGYSHSCALTSDGVVFSWGSYEDVFANILCDWNGTTCVGENETPVHVEMPNGYPVVKLWSGSDFNVAQLSDGSLVTWGVGNYGQLARSAGMVRPNQTVEALQRHDLIGLYTEQETGELISEAVREKFLTPRSVDWETPGQRRIVDAACGLFHLLVVVEEEDGSFGVYVSGFNEYGQLGLGESEVMRYKHKLTKIDGLNGVVKVAATYNCSFFLNHQGELFSCGSGDNGEFGNGRQYEPNGLEALPRRVAFPPTAGRIERIDTGVCHAVAITADGEIYTWGMNTDGQTGHPPSEGDAVLAPTLLDLQQHLGCPVRAVQAAGSLRHSLLVVQRLAENDSRSGTT